MTTTSIELRFEDPSPEAGPVIVVPLAQGAELEGPLAAIDEAGGGAIERRLEAGDVSGREGEVVVLFPEPPASPTRLLLVGLGKAGELHAEKVRYAGAHAANRIRQLGLQTAAVVVPDGLPPLRTQDLARLLADGIGLAQYRWEGVRSKQDDDEAGAPLDRLAVILPPRFADDPAVAELGRVQEAVHAGVATARDLANAPPNYGTPRQIADRTRAVCEPLGLRVEVLGPDELAEHGMGALLGVAQGSVEEPRLVVIEHAPAGASDTVCLVGKGVTFDSGGISIKPAKAMEEMKYDKAGAAAVVGTLEAVARLALPVRVVGIVPLVENLPSGRAIKPADVLVASDGTTIEIISTDAEGRLILADALCHARRFEPSCVIDLATLTGACVVALGKWRAGLFATDDVLAEELLLAGARTGERVWRLPLDADYRTELESDTADLKNSGGRWGGAVTAAKFLEHFTQGTPWAHLDIAGVAWRTEETEPYLGKGATGFGVRLLCDWLRDRASRLGATGAGAPQP